MASGPMDGKVVVVTGGSAGIGKAAALALAQQGAEVHLVCRNRERGEAAVAEIKAASGNGKVSSFYADLSLIAETKRVAREIAALPRVDVLVNNAGLICEKREETAEGHERTFATNHLGYFVLTTELLPKLKAQGTPVRIVSVSSGAHKAPRKVDLSDVGLSKGWSQFGAYGQSKLFNVLFTFELARRLKGTQVTATVMHPGVVGSNFGQSAKGVVAFFYRAARVFMRDNAKGAETVVWLASSPEAATHSGAYYIDRKARGTSALARDEKLQRDLWELSEKLAAAHS